MLHSLFLTQATTSGSHTYWKPGVSLTKAEPPRVKAGLGGAHETADT